MKLRLRLKRPLSPLMKPSMVEDGKPVEDPDKNKKTEEELLKDLSPELKAYLESMRKSVDDMAKKVGDSITNRQTRLRKKQSVSS